MDSDVLAKITDRLREKLNELQPGIQLAKNLGAVRPVTLLNQAEQIEGVSFEGDQYKIIAMLSNLSTQDEEHTIMARLKKDPVSRQNNYEILMPNVLPRADFAKEVGISLAQGEKLPSQPFASGHFLKVVIVEQERLEAALRAKHGVEFPERGRG